MYELPTRHEPYADKYFLRTNQILKEMKLNPWVWAQLFIRRGPGKIQGIDEAVAIIDKYSDLRKNGGKVYALKEGADYSPKETLMVIKGKAQDIVELETMYLGVITAETTKANDGIDIDLAQITKTTQEIVKAAGGRPVSYFGARHWRYDADAAIAKAAHDGGATSCSTDAGAATFGQKGMGTIPHALENIIAWKFGYDNAVRIATESFDRFIDPAVPRIALIDYANREIDDSIATADALQGRLCAVRVDTCGENIAQGAVAAGDRQGARELFDREIIVPTEEEKYWFGNGVTVSGVYALRHALDAANHKDVKIFLSSGFGDPRKVEAFTRAENLLGQKIYDALGVGGIYPARTTTMDIIGVGYDENCMEAISKVGRYYTPNARLEQMLGKGFVRENFGI